MLRSVSGRRGPSCAEKPPTRQTFERFVIASSAALRDGPATSSGLRIHLPVATPLRVACEDGGWLQAWAPMHGGNMGWIRADLVGDEEPSLPGELDRLRAASPRIRDW
ncbi:hypothetical protein ACQ86G_19340 [Roseateles chitinivorans]|uniref:hypothetical protein n=1 Tax=Roseateles chitinivorans TaxID=2917965 RepID=UPI003D67A637